MREFANLSIRLMLICAVAGAALGLTNMVTKEKIAEQIEFEANQARQDLFPDAKDFEEITETVSHPEEVTSIYAAKGESGTLGYAVGVTVTGYKGPVAISVGVKDDGSVVGIRIGASDETPGLGAKIKEEAFYGQFAGVKPEAISVTKDGGEIEAVSAATISSRAVCKGVSIASETVSKNVSGADTAKGDEVDG